MVTHQLQVERRTAKERWPETNVLPLSHAVSTYAPLCILTTWLSPICHLGSAEVGLGLGLGFVTRDLVNVTQNMLM